RINRTVVIFQEFYFSIATVHS
ncbi:unnamed protein product, partial [Allacma fusca]